VPGHHQDVPRRRITDHGHRDATFALAPALLAGARTATSENAGDRADRDVGLWP
jgi:hypothetical protein